MKPFDSHLLQGTMLTLTLFLIVPDFAQVSTPKRYRVNTSNTNAWFMHVGNHQFSRSLAWYTEVHIQRNKVVDKWQQAEGNHRDTTLMVKQRDVIG